MIEITLYASDIEQLKSGRKLLLYNSATGIQEASLVLNKSTEVTQCDSKLPTEPINNPVSNCL